MATALKLKNDIKKLKAAISSKATPKSFVPKLKAQLDKAENELASLKKSGRPRKTSTTKGTATTLSALQKLIQKKKFGVYQGAGVDLKKDAGEGAFATGRRVSKGLKSNQWGDASENKGNVYYEYRPNRLDVKQPKKKQTYPKLERGGMMAKGGVIGKYELMPYTKGVNDLYSPKYQAKEYFEGEKDDAIEKANSMLSAEIGMVQVLMVNPKATNALNRTKKIATVVYEDGGYMASGGGIDEIDMEKVESAAKFYTDESRWSVKPTISKFEEEIKNYKELKRKLDNKETTPSKIIGSGYKPQLARPLAYKWLKEKLLIAERAIEMLKEKEKMSSGGYMADGGQVVKYYGVEFTNTFGISNDDFKKAIDSFYDTGSDVNYERVAARLNISKLTKELGEEKSKEVFGYIKSKFEKKGVYSDGGEVGQGFLIRDMREKLNKMFPDTFGFTVGNISKEGNEVQNSSALVVDRRDPYRGLEDKDIQSKLFFPQYKRDHDIRFRIYQGGENTYFYFLLESENGDQYIGQFGFKDQGDVSSDYVTRFIAFLMEQYGLPFEVKHSVMAKGGYMAGGGEMHKADHFKDGGEVFSEKKLKEILDEALGHFYQGLNQVDLAMRYLEVKGQGGLKKPLSNKLKLDDLKESINKIDEYISK